MNPTKKLSTGKVWCFAVGQFGWSVLAALISSWLADYFQPPVESLRVGQPIFIPQGLVIFGAVTILGAITAFGRIFDAITDPLIATMSDRCKSKSGRRIPFMRIAAIPFALTCILTFWSPKAGDIIPFASVPADSQAAVEEAGEVPEVEAATEVLETEAIEAPEAADEESQLTPEQEALIEKSGSWGNAAFLAAMLLLFYLFMTMYCTPYNALIPELGADQKTRMAISTSISFTYIAGMALAYVAPSIWGMLQGAGLERVLAIRLTFTGLALLGMICMFVPVFTIREKDYVTAAPTESTAFKSLAATFRNRDFRVFVASDIAYFLGITMFQTAMPYFVKSLLGLPEGWSGTFFVLMTGLSLVFYLPVHFLTRKLGKKKLILFAFVLFTASFIYTALFGKNLPIAPEVQGYILCVVAAPAMAIFGILPQAVVADISEYDALETGENRSGMFFAARTFAFKLGQSLAMLLVTTFATIGQETGAGYRITAIAAAVVCVLGGVLFMLYNEKKVYARILRK